MSGSWFLAPGTWLCFVVAVGCATERREARMESKASEETPILLENVRVWGNPRANAVLIAGDLIEKVGDASELRAWTASTSMDMGNALVLPGFHDSHIHMLGGGLSLARAQLHEAKTLERTLELVAEYAKNHPDRPWILGRGWSYDIVPQGKFPTAEMLDRVVNDRPVALDAYDGHTVWLNSKALELAKITRDTKDPADGKIARDAKGNPTGALLEGAESLLEGVIPEPSRAQKKDALALAIKSCLALGITSVDAIEADLETFDLFLEIASPLRVNVILPIEGDLDRYAEMRKRGTDRVQLIGVKGFVDGVVESRTAFVKDPYTGTQEVGKPLIPSEKLIELVDNSAKRGFIVTLHAIGDAAVALSLDAFERAGAGLAHRVEHIEVLDPKDAPRFQKIGAVASMQPYHATPGDGDPDAGAWSENLGQPRLKERTFAWRTLLNANAPLVFGSDWPVFTHNPFYGVAIATTRQSENGNPKGGWNAHQALSFDEVIRASSRGRTIAEGQPADLVVVDITADDVKTIWKAKPKLVMVAGKRQ